jgi:16S rRNA processing protein RimM
MIPHGHVVVGEVVGVFGIKGAVKVEPRTDFPSRFAKNARLFLGGVPVTVVECHWHKGQARVRLAEVATPEDAEKKRGQLLTVPGDETPKLAKDEYLTRDLIGCRVIDEREGEIGTVDAVERGVSHDNLRVGSLQIPCVKAFIKKLDLHERVIHVALIEGMREEE